MTIIVAVVAKPKGKKSRSNPYFLIGSDSRVIKKRGENIEVSDDFQKTFLFKNKIIGIAGKTPDTFITDLSVSLRDLNLSFEETCSWLTSEVQRYIDDYMNVHQLDRFLERIHFRMILGTVDKKTPKMSIFDYDTAFHTSINCEILVQESKGFEILFIGDTAKTSEQQRVLKKRLGQSIDDINETQRMIKEFMKFTSEIYPQKVNDDFSFKIIEVSKNGIEIHEN